MIVVDKKGLMLQPDPYGPLKRVIVIAMILVSIMIFSWLL